VAGNRLPLGCVLAGLPLALFTAFWIGPYAAPFLIPYLIYALYIGYLKLLPREH